MVGRFLSKVWNVLSNIQYHSTRSSFIQISSQLKGSSNQSRDHFDSISNEHSITERDIAKSSLKHKDCMRRLAMASLTIATGNEIISG